MKDLEHTNHWIKVHGDLFIDLVRIYLGVGLFFKGVYFASHTDALVSLMERSGNLWFASGMIAHFVIMAHLVGGFFLAIGLITRGAALVQVPVLATAAFFVYLPKMFGAIEMRENFEFTALILFLLILISIYGAGRWSVDFYLARKENEKLFRPDDVPVAPPPQDVVTTSNS
jgi:putative oxidoreductase